MAVILVGCEESQAITIALRKLGHEAFSCDLLPCSGGHPEWHIQGDIFVAIASRKWDMLIAHPPCTFLTNSAVQWLSHPEDRKLAWEDRRPHPKYPNRRADMFASIEFVKALYNCEIPLVAIENPVGLLGTRWQKYDQKISPWMFGDEAEKQTCFWLKGLPKLTPTKIVGKGEYVNFKSGKRMQKWMADALTVAKTDAERRTLRSKTFKGIADAIAQQWGDFAEVSRLFDGK